MLILSCYMLPAQVKLKATVEKYELVGDGPMERTASSDTWGTEEFLQAIWAPSYRTQGQLFP